MTRAVLRVRPVRPGARTPTYGSGGAAGLDLGAALDEPLILEPSQFVVVPTGIAIALPAGHEGQVRPRSGLAVKHGVTVLNAPGTIDEDYRGEVKVPLINLGPEHVVIHPGDRIAQLVVAPVTRVAIEQVDQLTTTPRGNRGFGSTGLH